jgi:chemotaxis protein MotA
MNIFIPLGFAILVATFYLSVPDVFINPEAYVVFEALIMVAGGIVAMTIASSTASELKSTLKAFGVVLKKSKLPSDADIVNKIVGISIKSQKEGKMAIEDEGKNFGDGFLDSGIQMVVDKLAPDFIRNVLETNIMEASARHEKIIAEFKTMGGYGPMFGMLGTIVGIVQVLANMSDPTTVGPSMALALLTSLYGVFFASTVFSPFANKLGKANETEALSKQIITEGIIMIARGDIPIKVENYLRAYLSPTENKKKSKKGG